LCNDGKDAVRRWSHYITDKKELAMGIDKSMNMPTTAAELRCHAEELVCAHTAALNVPQTEEATLRLVHELEVHQIELEMQNAELRLARYEVEAALEKYTDLYEFAPVGYVTLDRSGSINAVNLAGSRLLGVERSRLIGRQFGQFVTKECLSAFTAFLGSVRSCRVKESCEAVLQNRGHQPVNVQIEAIVTATGQEFRLALIDITGRKQLETEIQDAREYAESIVETVRRPLVVLNYDLKILSANKSFYYTFKVTPEETIGNLIFDLGNRQWDIPELRLLLEEILHQNTVSNGYNVEHEFFNINRKTIIFNARRIFRKKSGSYIILLAMEDITERKQLGEELQKAHDKLESILTERTMELTRANVQKQKIAESNLRLKEVSRTKSAMLLRVRSLNNRLDSAYHNIARLSSFGEQIITNFDPATFDFLEKVDSIVHQIIRKGSGKAGSPQIVVIGMIGHSGICQWIHYDSTGKDIIRSSAKINIDHTYAFSGSSKPEVVFYNEGAPILSAPALVEELQKQLIPVSNMVRYSNGSFCLIALNYGREVTTHDATVLHSVVMQSLFLRSLAAQVRDTESAFEYTVLALARASEANDEDTGDHILRVGNFSALLARQLRLPEKRVQVIRIQAALHDVGKMHVSPTILKKPGTLTDDEWSEMKMHTLHGSQIIGGHHRMSTAEKIALSHHERYDGSGYPYGLSGEQIPIEGRILNLADQYDALRNARCYKPAYDHKTTCRIITTGDCRTLPHHFDPRVLSAFKEIHEKFAEVFEGSLQECSKDTCIY
jgi:PAS domain S-box-containing protein